MKPLVWNESSDESMTGRPRASKAVGALAGALVGTLLAAVMAVGCAGTAPAPSAGESVGFIPDLRGRRVMVFPVQLRAGVAADADPEIAFALRTRTTEVAWIFSEELEAVVARSPSVDTAVRGLPVGVFLSAEIERVGDPLYGQLLRLGALTNSEVALIPVAIGTGGQGVDSTLVVEIAATIVNVRSGQVIWFGVVGGRPGPVADFGLVASAVEELAETLLWYVR